MFSGSILTSNSTLNNFQEQGSLEIIRGEEVNLQIKIKDPNSGNRYIPDSAATITVTFNISGGTVVKSATMNPDDRSIISLTLDEVDTSLILSGDIKFTILEGTVTKKGIIVDGLQMATDC